MPNQIAQPWHSCDVDAVEIRLNTSCESGLTSKDAGTRLIKQGPNELKKKQETPAYIAFLQQLNDPLMYVLIGSAFVTFILKDYTEFGVILAVVLLNALIGFIQERKATNAIAALGKLLSAECTVVRDGVAQKISTKGLVPGDVVMLASGDRVPADLRLVKLRDLKIEEAMLTGESVPSEKNTDTLASGAVLADRSNMAYSGTLITYGTGSGIVVETAGATELGKISTMVDTAKKHDTPLTQKLAGVSIFLTWTICFFAVISFVFGIVNGQPFSKVFIAAVALAVAAIPEGLPAAVTIVLAIGVTYMANRHAIIRKLPAVETLGSTTVICTDKTGTLTQNAMTVVRICTSDGDFSVTGKGYAPEGHVSLDGKQLDALPTLTSHCVIAAALCNDARLVQTDGRWCIEGDPTEGSLLTLAAKLHLPAEGQEDKYTRLDTIPFESERQYMATLNNTPDGVHICVKGSIERLLTRCRYQYTADLQTEELDEDYWNEQAAGMANKGIRVLAVALKPAAHLQHLEGDEILDQLIFIGLIGMIDPPREEAVSAVKLCREAGITVKMITGDHPLTAKAIAVQCGLADENEIRLMTGKELESVPDDYLPTVASKTHVFARVAPEQKLNLVNALQSLGEIVAMTGDGVNDAPALKKADIGISMGITGTEAAKDASDMVLADDNFASIAAAVEEGRGVFDNLRKFISWSLPTNGGLGLLILYSVFTGQPPAVSPAQILWINLITAVVLGTSLAFEPKERGLMLRPPKKPNEPLLPLDLMLRILMVSVMMLAGGLSLYDYFHHHQGLTIPQSQSIAATTVVGIEIGFLFCARSRFKSIFEIPFFSNKWIHVSVITMLLLQYAFVSIPVMQDIFSTASIPFGAWSYIIGVTLVCMGIVEIDKVVWRSARHMSALKSQNDSD
ncbi:MAG: cation-translocating P-type ATPase [Armatimonadota bacterium]